MEKLPLTNSEKHVMMMTGGEGECGNLSLAFKIKGKIDRKKFESAIQKTIDDNDSLRFRIYRNKITGELEQYIYDQIEYILDERSVPGNTYEEKYDQVNKMIKKIYENSKFGEGILWNFVLFNLGNEDYIFWGRVNHIITDGVSLALTANNIIANYLGKQLPLSKSYKEFLLEQEIQKKSDEYQAMKTEFDEYFKNVNYSGEIYEQVCGDKQAKIEFNYFTTLGNDKLLQFCRTNRMSMFHVSLFLYHVAISILYNKKDTIISIPVGSRKYEYMNTIGCLADLCWSRMIVDNDMSMKDVAVLCRNNYFKSAKMMDVTKEKAIATGASLEFVFSYQNQVSDFNKAIPFGEAQIEFITDPKFGKEKNHQLNKIVAALSVVEAKGNVIFTLLADKDIFPEDQKAKAKKIFELGAECLTSDKDITFGDFCKLVENHN